MKNALHNVNLKDIIFEFDKIMASAETRKVFLKHLATEFNQEPLLFLEEVQELEKIPFPEQESAATKKALDICCTFLANLTDRGKGVPKEINVGADTLQSVISALTANEQHKIATKWVSDVKTPSEIYRYVKNTILLELSTESFPRFIRSKTWLDFLRTKDAKFLNTCSTLKTAIKYNYTDHSFRDHVVTEQDFRFMEQLAMDDFDWELQGYHRVKSDHSVVNGFFSYKQYMPNVSWMKNGSVAKIVATLPYSFEHCIAVRVPSCNSVRMDANVYAVKEHKYYDNATLKAQYPDLVTSPYRACAVHSYDVRLPFPLKTKRRYMNVGSIEYDPAKEQVMLIHKPCDFDATPKGVIDLKDLQLVMLRKIDSQRTLFTEIHIFNVFGWGQSQTLQRLIIMERAKIIQKKLLETLKAAKEGTFVCNDPNDCLIRCLKECQIEKQRADYKQATKTQHTQEQLLV